MVEFFKQEDHLKNGVAFVGLRRSKTFDHIYLNTLTENSSNKSQNATNNRESGKTLSLDTFPDNFDLT